MRAVFDGGYAGSRKRMKTVMDRDRRLVCTMGFVGGFTWTTGPRTSPDRLRRHRVRAAGAPGCGAWPRRGPARRRASRSGPGPPCASRRRCRAPGRRRRRPVRSRRGARSAPSPPIAVGGARVAGSGKGERHPEVAVGRLRPGGLPVPGLAAGTARLARPAVELPIHPAGIRSAISAPARRAIVAGNARQGIAHTPGFTLRRGSRTSAVAIVVQPFSDWASA